MEPNTANPGSHQIQAAQQQPNSSADKLHKKPNHVNSKLKQQLFQIKASV